MKKNFYNSKDDANKHVKNLLKELPKIQAADNFEYNLKVKIQNKNFGLNTEKEPRFNPWKIFAPATGILVASLAVFIFIFNSNPDSLDNPFQIIPKLRSEMQSSFMNSSILNHSFGDAQKVSELDVIVKENKKKEIAKAAPKDLVIDEKRAQKLVKSKKKEFPFENYASTDLDKVLEKTGNTNGLINRARLAGQSSSNYYFDGFFIGEEVDKEYVESLKARLDSVKMEILKKKRKINIAQ